VTGGGDAPRADVTHCAHTWEDGSDECIACGVTLKLAIDPPLDPPCPDCGNDPADESLHRENCRRVLPTGHPLERLQFGPALRARLGTVDASALGRTRTGPSRREAYRWLSTRPAPT
jgi:hypothetical protein